MLPIRVLAGFSLIFIVPADTTRAMENGSALLCPDHRSRRGKARDWINLSGRSAAVGGCAQPGIELVPPFALPLISTRGWS